MTKDEISTLIRFNFWANGRILAACEHLTPDQFNSNVTPDPGWGSLHNILVHILDTEYGWRAVLQGEPADIILEAKDFPDIATLKAAWHKEKIAWLDYVKELADEEVHQKREGNSLNVWQTIMHVVTHGTQHRSEAAHILTGHDMSPGELDFDLFLQENPQPNEISHLAKNGNNR